MCIVSPSDHHRKRIYEVLFIITVVIIIIIIVFSIVNLSIAKLVPAATMLLKVTAPPFPI